MPPPTLPKLPRHVAIIPDGNRKWARREGRPLHEGHQAGVCALRSLIYDCAALDGIEVLTVYALSIENWQRPAIEVELILESLSRALEDDKESLLASGVRVRFIGELERLSKPLQKQLHEAASRVPSQQKLTLCIAVSYGGQQEVARVARDIADRARRGEISTDAIDAAYFASCLQTSPHSAPSEPDLLIRTGGQHRLSNFMLFQLSYTEIVVLDLLWPDFSETQLKTCLQHFTQRKRTRGV